MKVKEKLFVIFILIIIAIITVIGFISVIDNIASYIEREMCYNMPLNEFYDTPICLKYKEDNNEKNR